MGKSGRHKKLNRQEKAKTKLKDAKKLGKAANVVNPVLKVKRIMIREQLQEQENEGPTTTRKQSLEDLLSTVRHHNTTLRKEAVQGLLQLLTRPQASNPLRQNLGKVLEACLSLTSDLEGVVRKENLRVLEAVLSMVEEPEIIPFWSLVLTQLRCSLTHLKSDVRFGTLPVFRFLVQNFPGLVIGSLPSILPSLLSLISSQTGGKGTTQIRTDVSKDQAEQRVQVFSLILACMMLKKEGRGEGKDATLPNLEYKDRGSGLLYQCGYSIEDGISIAQICSLDSSANVDKLSAFWAEFIPSCVSCVMQTWVELGPVLSNAANRGYNALGSDNRNESATLNALGVDILSSLTNLLIQILDEGSEELIMHVKGAQGPEITKHFFSHIPFASIFDADKEKVITANLQLFLLARRVHLLDKKMQRRLESLIQELMMDESYTLTWPQCEIVLELLSSHDSQVATSFITFFMSKKPHRRELVKYLGKIFHQNETLVQTLDWDAITVKLMDSFGQVSCKWLNLLTQIALRRLTDVQGHLRRKKSWFKAKFTADTPAQVWLECARLFWFADAIPLFKECLNEHIPVDTMKLLDLKDV